VLLPFGLAAIYFGGPIFAGVILLILGLAAWEFGNLFRAGGYYPASVVLIPGTLLLVAERALYGFENADWMISLVILVSMAYHLVAFERGRDKSASDFAITLGGVMYLGWIGAYLISLRSLHDGMWWVLLVLPAVWLADGGAYFIGKGLGRHHMSPRLSPKKTWEGYLGGILVGTFGSALLAYFWGNLAEPGTAVTVLNGAILGFVLSVVTVLGDLGASMVKRQVGVKDSSKLIPGHGGVFDRIDSWLWAGVIGYYLIVWLFI
jgi:phosphatidate cytidylyltransferase